jgi:hypothetical protein
MKRYSILIGIILLFSIFTKTAFAQAVTPSISDSPSSSDSASLPSAVDSGTNANNTITGVSTFISNLEKLSGGFVFSTPDMFADSVKLADGTAINGLSTIRNVFIPISIPLTAILIFWVGSANMMQGKISFIKPFIGRIAFYGVLAIMLTTLLSYTIQAENALTNVILNIPSQKITDLTSFSTDFFNAEQNQISSGKSTPESLGIYNSSITSFFQSIGYRVTMMLLGLVTILALIVGIVFILAQFALRFLGMLFLSLIYPLVLPFVITQKTEGIFYTYLRVWFTFLIHQPAFALGYVIVMIIARSILTTNGASLGLLFLYIAALFFLGTINVLASRIFADALLAAGANFEAGALGRAGNILTLETLKFGRNNGGNIISGAKALGKTVKESMSNFSNATCPPKKVPNFAYASPVVDGEYAHKPLQPGFIAGKDVMYGNPPPTSSNKGSTPIVDAQTSTSSIKRELPIYANEFQTKGFTVKEAEGQNGIYSVSGSGYSHYDTKNNLTHIFPTKKDALAGGYREDQVNKVEIDKRKVIDLSQLQKENPHNLNTAYLTRRNNSTQIKRNLEINQEKLKGLGVDGYVSRHQDSKSGSEPARQTTRIVTVGKLKE